MIITYHSAACFKVQFGDTVLAFNPVAKEGSSAKPTRFGADITLVSVNHPNFNGVSQTQNKDADPFIIRGPGEYEVQGITIRGFDAAVGGEKAPRHNTIYVVELEGMTLCFLGALGSAELPHDAMEAIDEIDILFTPIGGTKEAGGDGVETLDASAAYKLAVQLEPRMIIPMLYDPDAANSALATFLEEGGREKQDPVEKLTVKQKDVAGKEGEITVLAAQ